MSAIVDMIGPEGGVHVLYDPGKTPTIWATGESAQFAKVPAGFFDDLVSILSTLKCRRALVSYSESGSFVDNPTAKECSHIYTLYGRRVMSQSEFSQAEWQNLFNEKI
jgi:hypothetical protein